MLGHNLFERTRTAPTGYEKVRLLFHGIRTAQVVSALIVGSFVIYFMWALKNDNLEWPWTFITLVVTSMLTLIALTMTLTMHALTGLSPRFNLAVNGVLLFLWTIGYGMLSYWTWGTLTNQCSTGVWHDDVGVMVCQIYKAMFTFALIGTLAALCAIGLDIHIYRLSVSRGAHMRLDELKNPASGPVFSDDHSRDPDDVDGFPSRNSEAFEVPQRMYAAQPDNKHAERGGYAHPDEQFGYDTGYHGGHEERALGRS